MSNYVQQELMREAEIEAEMGDFSGAQMLMAQAANAGNMYAPGHPNYVAPQVFPYGHANYVPPMQQNFPQGNMYAPGHPNYIAQQQQFGQNQQFGGPQMMAAQERNQAAYDIARGDVVDGERELMAANAMSGNSNANVISQTLDIEAAQNFARGNVGEAFVEKVEARLFRNW